MRPWAWIQRSRAWAQGVKRDGLTLWFACRHPGTPRWVKLLGLFVAAYALSPIDLIPDFIPVLGYLDEVVLLPLLIALAVRGLPPAVLQDCRQQANDWMARRARPVLRWGAALVLVFWLLLGTACWHLFAAHGSANTG